MGDRGGAGVGEQAEVRGGVAADELQADVAGAIRHRQHVVRSVEGERRAAKREAGCFDDIAGREIGNAAAEAGSRGDEQLGVRSQ